MTARFKTAKTAEMSDAELVAWLDENGYPQLAAHLASDGPRAGLVRNLARNGIQVPDDDDGGSW